MTFLYAVVMNLYFPLEEMLDVDGFLLSFSEIARLACSRKKVADLGTLVVLCLILLCLDISESSFF